MGSRRYSKAPITEAVIDLRASISEGVSLDQLSAMNRGREDKYPKATAIFRVTGQVSLETEHGAVSERNQIGFAFRDVTERYVMQATIEGFTLSRLAPYEHWEPFREEAQTLWNAYRELAGPQSVQRIAVRYINRFHLPIHTEDISQFMGLFIEVPSGLPQMLSTSFLQCRLELVNPSTWVNIIQAALPSESLEAIPLILDIDVAKESGLPAAEADIWQLFEQLRFQKNSVFEACITDKTREIIS